jgi:hypothetical protein
LPSWFYRLTIKSTAWFWWPLAFLGGDLDRARNPELFRWKVMGSLWAKASIGVAAATLIAFVGANFYPAFFTSNPYLTPLGYLLLIDWNLWPWQVFALLGAAMSVLLVVLVNDVSGEYAIAERQGNARLRNVAEWKFGWIERLGRARLIVFILFWLIVGTHGLLFLNSQKCWLTLPTAVHEWATSIYGERLPRACECVVWPFLGFHEYRHSHGTVVP